jgi:hypothetical protein
MSKVAFVFWSWKDISVIAVDCEGKDFRCISGMKRNLSIVPRLRFLFSKPAVAYLNVDREQRIVCNSKIKASFDYAR